MLAAVRDGKPGATHELAPLVYAELRELAERALRGERPGHTLQPTALVHEAFLRLVDTEEVRWDNRAHFFGAAGRAMRRILVDYARSRDSWKRGGRLRRVSLEGDVAAPGDEAADFAALDAALTRLHARDPRKSSIVELRFFVGLPVREIADVLGLSERTVRREWAFAKAWLVQEMEGEIEREENIGRPAAPSPHGERKAPEP